MTSAEKVAAVKPRWAEGISATQIAIELSAPSRSAVLSVTNRMGMVRQSPTRHQGASRRAVGERRERVAVERQHAPPLRLPPSEVLDDDRIKPVPRRLGIMDLPLMGRCKWLLHSNNEACPPADLLLYCGADAETPTGVWCRWHAKIVYTR